MPVAVDANTVRVPDASQPIGYVNNDRSKPVYIDPVWLRFILAQAELANATKAEVDAQHP